MTVDKPRFIFLDFDGVMTACDQTPGSYLTHSIEEYGVSRRCYRNLLELISKTDSKVVISSNWRKFSDDPNSDFYYWRHMTRGKIPNPLPKFKARLKSCLYGQLPSFHGVSKSQSLLMWMRENSYDENTIDFVIFDDDLREGFQNTTEYNIDKHFIMTDSKVGLSIDDCEKAKNILNCI